MENAQVVRWETLDSSYPRLRSLASALIEHRVREAAPNEQDNKITPAHFVDDALHNLAHSLQHAVRLGESDVADDPAALEFNVDHCRHHLEAAQNVIARLDNHLRENASDPEEYAKQRDALTDWRQSYDENEDEDEDKDGQDDDQPK